MQVLDDVQTAYRNFAVYAAGNSSCFEEWALGVAVDREVQRWPARLPEPKRQPNLVFAAARWHGLAAPGPYDDLREARLGDTGRIHSLHCWCSSWPFHRHPEAGVGSRSDPPAIASSPCPRTYDERP